MPVQVTAKVTVFNPTTWSAVDGGPSTLEDVYADVVSVEADYEQLYLMGPSGAPKAIYAKGYWQKVVIS